MQQGTGWTRPPVSFGRHQLLFAIGHGGMSDVYLALVHSGAGVNKLLVVKQLRPSLLDEPEALSMFMDEARLAARLHHPNVVQTFEVGQAGPIPYITMEFLDGQPLHRILRRIELDRDPEHLGPGPLSLAMALRIAVEMLEGLHYAHELRGYDGSPMNVVHRDISPQNLVITYDGQIKLVDFGIAKAADSVTHTEAHGLKGKLAYMSPQQARGELVDRRADVYAAGVVLWELISGRRLWDGCNEATIAGRLVVGDLPELDVPELPRALLEICERAVAPAVEDRYPTAEAVRLELERVMHELQLEASAREIGKLVATLFEAQRVELRARIDQDLRELTGETSTATPSLWRDEYREATADPMLGADEVTTDYGPPTSAPPEPPPADHVAPADPADPSGPVESPVRGWRAGWGVAAAGLGAILLLALATVDRAPEPATKDPTELGSSGLAPNPAPTPVHRCDQPDKPRVRLSGDLDEDATLTCDHDYLLVFTTRVSSGVTLTIEPGTTVYGDRETKGVLVVQPEAKLIAAGTRDRPIVFTSEQPPGDRRPGDWGGVILLGQAPINLRNADGEPITGQVEGLSASSRYGGDQPDDDSGVLRYVRIEYAGSELGPANEINGLTLAGVGRGTVIDHLEVRATSDDCFEFFGGTVDAKHLICDSPGDDAFDFDHGYQGRLQFVVVRDQPAAEGDPNNAIEIDNDPGGTTATPRTRPVIWNATLCGAEGPRSPSFAVLARRAANGSLGAARIRGFDYVFDQRDVETEFALEGFALADQPLAEADEHDDDTGFDELRWLQDPGRHGQTAAEPELCVGRSPASLIPRVTVPLPDLAAGPPDDGFFDPAARWLGAFAGPDDDWTAGWTVWTES